MMEVLHDKDVNSYGVDQVRLDCWLEIRERKDRCRCSVSEGMVPMVS
jgi:hypothetical protein